MYKEKEKYNLYTGKKVASRNYPERVQMLNLLDKVFKSAVLNLCQERRLCLKN